MDASAEPVATRSPWSARRWLAWGALAVIGLGLALWIQQLPRQAELFKALNHMAAALPDRAWACLTVMGETDALFTLLSMLLLWRPQALLAVFAAVPVGGLFSVTLKNLFDAPRPAAVLDAAQFHLIGPLLSNHSFPSGHSITAFAAAGAVLACLAPTRLTGRFVGLALMVIGVATAVGLSRVAVGAHWPVDVLAGASSGWLAGLSGAWLARRWPGFAHAMSVQRIVGVALGVLALWLIWRPLTYPQSEAMVWLAVCSAVITLAGQIRVSRVSRSTW